MKNIIGNNIRKLRKEHNYTQKDLADLIHVKPTTVASWEQGRNKPLMDKVTKLANLFHVSLTDIAGDQYKGKPIPGNVHLISDHIRRIPIIGTIAMGTPIIADENVIGHTSEEFDDVPKDELFALKCKGHSMEPTIPDGAIAIFEATSEVEDGEIAAVLLDHDEEATLKRVQHSPDGQIFLKPDNNSYPTIALNDKNPGRIIGRLYEFKVLAHRK